MEFLVVNHSEAHVESVIQRSKDSVNEVIMFQLKI